MLKWFGVALNVLRQEPEEWLAYKYGQIFEKAPELKKTKPRLVGFSLKFLGYVRFLMKNSQLKFMCLRKPLPKVEYLFFYSTENQRKSLEQTMDSLRRKQCQTISFSLPELNEDYALCKDDNYRLWFNVSDVLRSSILFILRVFWLIKRLREKEKILVSWYLDKFIQPYIYICCFYRIFRCCQPSVLVLANDHNVSNRCAMAVAEVMGVKVAYLQHASVSSFFPALQVDYAFLDGKAALDVYRECTNNRSPTKEFEGHRVKVFLSGQKKLLDKNYEPERNLVGIAINPLDQIASVKSLVEFLVKNGKYVSVRWHPGQNQSDILDLKNSTTFNVKVSLSNPAEESVSDYFSKLSSVIAGNSSIHLEAALKGIQCIYYEFGKSSVPDYYSYVKYGIAEDARSEYEVLSKLKTRNLPAPNDLRYYSATFGTVWEGYEGELVAETLVQVMAGKDWLKMFGAYEI